MISRKKEGDEDGSVEQIVELLAFLFIHHSSVSLQHWFSAVSH